MQKLITILLHDSSRDSGQHGEVEEHLKDYLLEGWRITSVTPVGQTGGQSRGTRAWLAIVLDRD
jgi:hypothetical protein